MDSKSNGGLRSTDAPSVVRKDISYTSKTEEACGGMGGTTGAACTGGTGTVVTAGTGTAVTAGTGVTGTVQEPAVRCTCSVGVDGNCGVWWSNLRNECLCAG